MRHVPQERKAGRRIRRVGDLVGNAGGRRDQRDLVVDVADRIEPPEPIGRDAVRRIVAVGIVQRIQLVIPGGPFVDRQFQCGLIRQ